MSLENPLVSVLMTAYNREQFIGEAIESVLKSTYTNFELIIVDDFSSDKTVDISKYYEAKDQRIKVRVNEKNLGQFANRNRALTYAKGRYIKYFDSDDIMHSDCLSIMVFAMEENPTAFAGAEHQLPINKLPVLYTPKQLFVNHYFKGNNLLFIGPGGVIFKKEVFEQLGGFDEFIGILADTLFMLKIAARYPIVGFIPYTFTWRRHDEQVTIGQDDLLDMMLQRKRINDITLDDPNCPLDEGVKNNLKRNLKAIFLRNLSKYLITGNYKLAREIYKESKFSLADYINALRPNYKIDN